MTSHHSGGGKLPGKTKYAGRRRDMTRRSGFTVHEDTTGGEFQRRTVNSYRLNAGEIVEVVFRLQGHEAGDLLGYGMWFRHTPGVERSLVGGPKKRTLTQYNEGSWNKIGSIWKAQNTDPVEIILQLKAMTIAEVALYEPICGRLHHEYLDNAREALLANMFQTAPEAIFIDAEIHATADIKFPEGTATSNQELVVKSCNRCGRYLPINVPDERNHLSFTNHCSAKHLIPCKHSSFGRLRNIDNASDVLQLTYGFQLECRFCKKFTVNAAHNPQRTSAQMKEDVARRRAFELLLAELYQGTPQLRYRAEHGSELTDDVWNRFERACFNCGLSLEIPRLMHLDHTRPLALLWPLDGTATCLCQSCNSEKRDRPPGEFYPDDKLVELSRITGIGMDELTSPHPNEAAIRLLLSRLDWFFGDFLTRDEMVKERDGKITGELVVKALHKVLARSEHYRNVDLKKAYEQRRIQ